MKWLFGKYKIQYEAYSGSEFSYWATEYDKNFYTINGAIRYITKLLNVRLKNGAKRSKYRVIDYTVPYPRTKIVAQIDVKYKQK